MAQVSHNLRGVKGAHANFTNILWNVWIGAIIASLTIIFKIEKKKSFRVFIRISAERSCNPDIEQLLPKSVYKLTTWTSNMVPCTVQHYKICLKYKRVNHKTIMIIFFNQFGTKYSFLSIIGQDEIIEELLPKKSVYKLT